MPHTNPPHEAQETYSRALCADLLAFWASHIAREPFADKWYVQVIRICYARPKASKRKMSISGAYLFAFLSMRPPNTHPFHKRPEPPRPNVREKDPHHKKIDTQAWRGGGGECVRKVLISAKIVV